jgi:hypothetical protein
MAQNFPSNPTLNTPYTINNESWAYDGSGWVRVVTASGTGILPSVSGNSGKYLTTDGSTISWGTVTTSSVTISDTAPVSPTSGNIWFDSTKLNTYVYYNDGDSSQWVNATSVSVGTILPTQTGNTGKFLTTDGSTVSWATFTGYAGSAGYSGSTGYTGSAGVGYAGSAAAGGGTPASVSSQANTATDFFAIPIGSTAQRPASPDYGAMRYNTTTGFAEVYTSGGWAVMGAAPPTITTVTPATYNGEAGTVFTVNGTNFTSDATVKFIDINNTEFTAALVTFVNSTQLTATTPQDFTVAQEPLDVRVAQLSGIVTKLDCIDTGGIPGWTTAAGQLGGTIIRNSSVSTSVAATDPDAGATITYSVYSGALPTGLSLNSNTGAITGTSPNVSSDTTYNFTLRVTDNAGNTADRAFSMIILTGVPPTVDYLVIAGGGGGGAQHGGGGGAGGYRTSTLSVAASTAYTVTVGGGGPGGVFNINGTVGNNSVFSSITSNGGGYGGVGYNPTNPGGAGGSGGGGGAGGTQSGGAGTAGQGSNGGTSSASTVNGGGGGGGAGGVGQNSGTVASTAGAGGTGSSSSITGTSANYAGGGGGGADGQAGWAGGSATFGGSAGVNINSASAATANTGGGGGAGGGSSGNGGAGGSGIVVIAYSNTYNALASISGGLTYDQPTRSGYRVYRFTAGTGPISW